MKEFVAVVWERRGRRSDKFLVFVIISDGGGRGGLCWLSSRALVIVNSTVVGVGAGHGDLYVLCFLPKLSCSL